MPVPSLRDNLNIAHSIPNYAAKAASQNLLIAKYCYALVYHGAKDPTAMCGVPLRLLFEHPRRLPEEVEKKKGL